MADYEPETFDTGSEDEFDGGNEDTAEEQEEEESPEPAESGKRWGGRFEDPADLEKDYMRKGQELNEMKNRLAAMEAAKAENAKPAMLDLSDPATSHFYREAMNEFDSDEELQSMYSEAEYRKIAMKDARRDAKLHYSLSANATAINEISKRMDPKMKPVMEAEERIPGLKEAKAKGDFDEVIRLMSEHRPEPPVNAARPTPNKANAGVGGKQAASNASGYKMSDSELQVMKALGVTTEAGMKAYIEVMRGKK